MSDAQNDMPLNWPDIGLQPHRFAGIFRMLSGDEKQAFADDIAKVGLKQRVKVYQDEILDGRNRYLALVDEGAFEPDDEHWRDRPELFEEFIGTDDEALDFVWSLNEQRRHDSASQRAMSAARYAKLRDITQAEAAEKFGVSERQVNSAAKIVEQAEPELIAAVDDGRVPAYLAEQLVDHDEDEQREVASKPRGEASAAARQKLQDPPPLSESGPVVKALDPARFVLFADAVMKTSAMGNLALSSTVIDALAREHLLLADADGVFNLSREAALAVDLARKRLSIADGAYAGMSAVIMGSAGLSDSLDDLAQAYRNAIVLYDRAIRGGDIVGEAKYGVAMEAVLFKANGNSQFGIATNDRPREVIAATRAPDGIVPMWGQQGCFIAEGEWRDYKVRAIVVLGRYDGIYAIDPGAPFPSETGYRTVSWGRFGDRTVEAYGKSLIEASIRGYYNDLNHRGPMLPPTTVYQITEGGVAGPVAVGQSGQELDRTAYQAALAALTEPKGKLHQATAADAIRAGVAAGVSRQQMAEDLGHPIGTVLTWTARLGLTDGSRKGASA